MKLVRFLFLIAVLCSVFVAAPVYAEGGSADFLFFAQTGHNVQGRFLQYYQGLENPSVILGFPITEEIDKGNGLRVQYFQRGRLELANGVVRPTNLGFLSYEPGVKLDFDNQMSCEEFPETGYSICFAFLNFFRENGGLGYFGYPISSFEFHDNLIVQYFQNGRMEWRPSNSDGQQVVMTDLGSSYFYAIDEDPVLLQAVQTLNLTSKNEVISLNLRAFVWKAATYSTDDQLIFIIVQDQTMQPLSGVSGTATVTWTDGTQDDLMIMTGNSGISTLSLSVKDQEYGGVITIDVLVDYDGVQEHTRSSFRIRY